MPNLTAPEAFARHSSSTVLRCQHAYWETFTFVHIPAPTPGRLGETRPIFIANGILT
jgi:hypothetical protein